MEDWSICYEVGLRFQANSLGSLECVACAKRAFQYLIPNPLSCRTGHGQDPTKFGICHLCDKNFLLRALKKEIKCRQPNCQRTLEVNLAILRKRLVKRAPSLLQKFQACLAKYNVYECIACCETVAQNENSNSVSKECNHDRTVCKSCLTTFFELAIREGRLGDLACPEVECRKPAPLDLIRETVSAQCLALYSKTLAFNAVAREVNFRWCICGHGQIHVAGASSPEWICVSCNRRHCFICKDTSQGICQHLLPLERARKHDYGRQRQLALARAEGLRRETKDNLKGSQAEVARTSKRCPRAGCQIPIYRDGGCGHMTCKNSKVAGVANCCDFCWSCKVIWRIGNGDFKVNHLDTCPLGTITRTPISKLDMTGYGNGWNLDAGYDLTLDSGLFLVFSQR